MLRGIRTASANWLGKTIMVVVVGVLALSFAIWGIGDIFRGGGQTAVASVGSSQITVEQFRQLYSERLQQIGAQQGRPIPPDLARELGIDRMILGQLMSELALDEWARRIGLGITDEEVARFIHTFPAFQGPNGQFDHALFLDRIRNAGYTEPRFVNEQRRLMIRQHLTESIGGLTVAPKTYVDAINVYQNEQRAIEYVVLGPAQAGEIPNPTPEQLTSFFDSRKAQFRAPEFRRIVLLRLSPDEIVKWIQVSDADARQFYDQRRARYSAPGRRHVQQMFFLNPDDAKAAADRIAAGTPFETVAKERGLDEKTFDLGMVDRGELSGPGRDPVIAETAFSLAPGATSPPVKGRLGTYVIRVVKADPDRVRPFEEVADEIKRELALTRTRAELNEKHDKIEDERAGGANLSEIAPRVGLTATVIEAVDRSGRDPSEAPVADLPRDIDVITPAFSTGVGVEADALRLDDGGYVWFDVTNITPARDRNLDEIRDRVEARWRQDQIAERLRAKAAEMVEKLKTGATLAELAAADTLTVQTANGLRRNAQAENLSPTAIAAVFAAAKGGVGSAEGRSADERIVFRVTDIVVPEAEPANAEGQRLQAALRNAVSEDLLREFIAYIERELGTTINTDALRRVAGGEAP